TSDAGNQFLAARPFAGRDQQQREQPAKGHARAGTEPPLLDGQAQHEKAAAGDGETASPNDPLRAETLFEAWAGPRSSGYRGRGGWFSGRLRWWGSVGADGLAGDLRRRRSRSDRAFGRS